MGRIFKDGPDSIAACSEEDVAAGLTGPLDAPSGRPPTATVVPWKWRRQGQSMLKTSSTGNCSPFGRGRKA